LPKNWVSGKSVAAMAKSHLSILTRETPFESLSFLSPILEEKIAKIAPALILSHTMTTTLAEVLDLFKQVAQAQQEVAQAQKDTDRLLREQSLESDIQPGETITVINGSQFQPKNW
ncbi:MAG: hypothetical protein ACKOX2_03200, partial [Microcystaceae cyanobacterium]